MSKLRQRTLFGGMVIVLGAVLFVLASAFVIDRNYSPILAAIVGAFAFPVAPVVWQLIGERRRAKRLADLKPVKGAPAPKPSSLTATDRFWMRFVAVAVVVLGPMIAVARFGIVKAAIHHGLWFIPTPPPDLRAIGEGTPRTFKDHELLMKHLPDEAEVAFVLHDPNLGGNLVAGWTQGKSAIVSEGRILLPNGESIADQARRTTWLGGAAPAYEVSTLDGTDALASEGWRTKVQLPGDGPSTALRHELARAPQNAQVVLAYVPHSAKDAKKLKSLALWVTLGAADDPKVIVEGRAEAGDIAIATELYARFNGQLVASHADRAEGCRSAISTLADQMTVVQNGTVITARAVTTRDTMAQLVTCAMN